MLTRLRPLLSLFLTLLVCLPAPAAVGETQNHTTLPPATALAAPGNGALDPSFGLDGIVTHPIAATLEPAAVLILPDGKLLVGGARGEAPARDFALARFLPDGNLDPTFGAGGLVVTDFSGGPDEIRALALQRDGKLLAFGGSHPGGPDSQWNSDLALARYLPDGRLDPAFGSGGKVLEDLGGLDGGFRLFVQPDGRLLGVGGSHSGSDVDYVALLRWLPDGRLDPEFNGGVKLIFQFHRGQAIQLYDAVLQPDGRILLSAWVAEKYSTLRAGILARFLPSGGFDPTFGDDGEVWLGPNGQMDHTVLALQPDGRILAAGIYGSSLSDPGDPDRLLLYRLTPSGAIDPTYDPGPDADVALAGLPANKFIAAWLGWDGRLILTGWAGSGYEDLNFLLLRFLPTGRLDPGFGAAGRALTDVGAQDFPVDLAAYPDGRLLLAGTSGPDLILARYLTGLPPLPVQNFLPLTHHFFPVDMDN